MWKRATPKSKKFKICIVGPPGSFKTRTALRLANSFNGDPLLAVIDTEFGTDHYSGEFNFLRVQTADADEIKKAVEEIIADPKSVKTLAIDSFSVYCETVTSKYVDLYQKRELRSPGHKVEYYQLQPRDWQPINREITRIIKKLLSCDLNVITTFQVKELWEDFKVVGFTHDGFKRTPYYFDTLIYLQENKKGDGFKAVVKKDRTNHLPKTFPWPNDEQAYEQLVRAFGHDLTSGPSAKPLLEDAPRSVDEKANADELSRETPNVTSDQLGRMRQLKKELQITDPAQWQKLLESFRVKTGRDLTADQAKEFIGQLEALRPTEAQGA